MYDGLGSTRSLTDSSGLKTDSYIYKAFGGIEHKDGITPNNYLFTGEQYDPNLGFYYLRARYYNQNNGRFFSLDTYQGRAFEPVTLHKYLYANADPVNMIDPTGNFSLGGFSAGQIALATLVGIASFGAGDYFLNDGRFHSYEEETVVCEKRRVVNDRCNLELAFEALRVHPAPFMFGDTPVEDGQISVLTLFGPVAHSVVPYKVTNTTLEKHLLYPGYVDRILNDNGNNISVYTYGEGTGPAPLINSFFSWPLWKSVDKQIQYKITGEFF